MKKIISLMLALLTVCVLFTGCGAKKDPDAFTVKIKVDGKGSFEFTTDGSEPKIDPSRLTTEADAQVGRGTKVNIVAQPEAPWIFVKWNKNGVYFSEDPKISVNVTEDVELEAIFGEPVEGTPAGN